MLRKANERSLTTKDNVQKGNGSIIFNEIASNTELFDKTTMYAVLTFKENCGIGFHEHHDEEEVILIIEGKAHCVDDNEEYDASVGDVVICLDGHGHSIENKEKEDLRIVALKIKK